jgi:hypothetical protein
LADFTFDDVGGRRGRIECRVEEASFVSPSCRRLFDWPFVVVVRQACVKRLKGAWRYGYRVRFVYYSDAGGAIRREKLDGMVSMHVSRGRAYAPERLPHGCGHRHRRAEG